MLFSLTKILKEKTFWISILFITLVAMLNATIPLATSYILNASLEGETTRLIKWLILIIVNIVLLLLFESFSQYYSVKFQNRMRLTMTTTISETLSKQSAETFLSKDKSYYINLYNNTTQILEEDYFKKYLAIYQGLIGIISNVFVLFLLDKILLVVVIVTSIIPLVIPLLSKNKLSKLKDNVSQKNVLFNEKLTDFLEGFLVARSFNSQPIILRRFTHSTQEVNRAKEKYEKQDVFFNMLSGLSFYVSFIAILVIGALRISRGLTTVGALTGTIQISDNLIYPIRLVSEEMRTLLSTKELRESVNRLLFDDINDLIARDSLTHGKGISLNQLSLSKDGKVLFDELSYPFEKNKKYVIIGESGVGKSTLLKIINGDMSLDSGYVLKQPDLTLRMVYQTPYLFHDTLHNNLTMFEKFNDTDSLNYWINQMNLSVSENNDKGYSGGEVQKISLVRALQSQPDCLLLDEATSALDEQNYQLVEHHLLTSYEGLLIAVSHRLTDDIKELYDIILLLKDGKLIEIKK